MIAAEEQQPEQAGHGHPTNGIDETVHQRHRLGILTITAEAQRAEFGYLREALGLTPGNLSKHLTVLEQAGMVEVEKGYTGRRPRTWSHHRPGPHGARRRTDRADQAPEPAPSRAAHLTAHVRLRRSGTTLRTTARSRPVRVPLLAAVLRVG